MYNVYKIINSINNKVYVGRTTRSLTLRWKEHLKSLDNGDMRHLYCAMRKYGVDKFKIILIEECKSLQEMKEKESYYCKYFNAYTDGYNMTTAGEANPMECYKSKKSHNDKMRSSEVRNKISATMKKVRANSKDNIYIYKDKNMKRISKSNLDNYLDKGWQIGTIKGKIRIHKDDKETTIFKDDLENYIASGWEIGGKHRLFSKSHLENLKKCHHNILETFRKEQSKRLKEYYKDNPDWETRSKKKVRVTNPKTGNYEIFNSCVDASRNMGIPESFARSGKFAQWVKLGYINYKKSKYNKYIVEFI